MNRTRITDLLDMEGVGIPKPPTMSPCPFCGSIDLTTNSWFTDDAEVDAVECDNCLAGTPVDAWNKRCELG